MQGHSFSALKPATVFLGGILAGVILSGAAFAYQENMHVALDHLEAARASLLRATPNKDGHRLQAISLVNQAIAETKRGISAGRN